MPIILTPLVTQAADGEITAESLATVGPIDSTHYDCPNLTKTRVLTVTKGVAATVDWFLRNRQGESVNIAANVPDDDASDSLSGQVIARFTDILGASSTIYQIIGSAVEAAAGHIQIPLSDELVAGPGIYAMEIGITDGSRLLFTDKGWLSIERGLFGSTDLMTGPPTIGEIRLQLRDTLIENDLLDAPEFDDAEIIHSLRRPVQKWNETPPPVASFTTGNFPYHDNWLKATIANLLRISAAWYERNRLQASHGGITVDDRNKSQPYLAVAQQLEAEWQDFVFHTKVSINAGLAIGSVNSSYGRWGY